MEDRLTILNGDCRELIKSVPAGTVQCVVTSPPLMNADKKTERPILFSGDLVRAIREGRKTQTRRLVKPQPVLEGVECYGDSWKWQKGNDGFSGVTREQLTGRAGLLYETRSIYGQVGHRLVVKEATWMWCHRVANGRTKKGRPKFRYVPVQTVPPIYCADAAAKPTERPGKNQYNPNYLWKYKSGRYMPRWACRLELEITGIRVERLQEISESDAKAEGIEPYKNRIGWKDYGRELDCFATATASYSTLWDKINGQREGGRVRWEKNPFVWVIEFRKV